jgi:hypothetical protein
MCSSWPLGYTALTCHSGPTSIGTGSKIIWSRMRDGAMRPLWRSPTAEAKGGVKIGKFQTDPPPLVAPIPRVFFVDRKCADGMLAANGRRSQCRMVPGSGAEVHWTRPSREGRMDQVAARA